MTPRQRCALAFPISKKGAEVHPRHHRVTMPYQTILTFDLFPDDELPENLKERAVNGRVGVWHARISTFPARPIATWDADTKRRASGMLHRLLAGVGIADLKPETSDDGVSGHAHRWASVSEVAQALRASEGKKEKVAEAAQEGSP